MDNMLLIAAYCEMSAPTDPEGTCGTGGNSSTIDFARTSHGFKDRVESIRVMRQYPSSPHRPVRITIRMQPRIRDKRLQIKPRMHLGRCKRQGCPLPPQPWPDILQQLDQQYATEVWKHVVTASVAENFA